MSNSKKKNPRRQPRTQEDVNRAYKQGTFDGAEAALDITLIVLKDLGEPDTYIDKFHAKFVKTLASLRDSEVKDADIKSALNDEYGIEVQVTDK